MAKVKKNSVGRRGFLKGAAAGAAALVAPIAAPVAEAQSPGNAPAEQLIAQQRNAVAPVPDQATLAREGGTARPAPVTEFIEHPGSDYMVDVIKSLDIEYLASNP